MVLSGAFNGFRVLTEVELGEKKIKEIIKAKNRSFFSVVGEVSPEKKMMGI